MLSFIWRAKQEERKKKEDEKRKEEERMEKKVLDPLFSLVDMIFRNTTGIRNRPVFILSDLRFAFTINKRQIITIEMTL